MFSGKKFLLLLNEGFQGREVAVDPQTGETSFRRLGREAFLSKSLSGVDVA